MTSLWFNMLGQESIAVSSLFLFVCGYRKYYAFVASYLFALVAVFYDWATVCGYFLFDSANHHYWLVTGSVVVGVCPKPIQNRPKNKGRPEIIASPL